MSLWEPPMRRVAFLGTWLLGVTFVSAAALKALDFVSFSIQQSRYDLIPAGWTEPVAVGILVTEAALGLCALLGVQARRAVLGMLLLLGLFAGATVLRWDALEGTECHCFGRLAGGGPASVVVQDVVLASVAALVLAAGRGIRPERPGRRWLRVVAGLASVIAVVFVAEPAPAGYSLADGSQHGDQIRVFLSAGCKDCRESLSKVHQLAQAPGLPPLKVFIGADSDQQIAEFLKGTRVVPEYAPLTIRQLAGFVPRVPTVQIVRDGKLRAEWSAEVPSVAQVDEAMRGISPTRP